MLGSAPTVERAVTLIEQGAPEVALLGLNLRGLSTPPVAAALNGRGVPFLIVSGYSELQSQAPEPAGAPRLAKPASDRQLVRPLRQLLMTVPSD